MQEYTIKWKNQPGEKLNYTGCQCLPRGPFWNDESVVNTNGQNATLTLPKERHLDIFCNVMEG